jgi:hypothetical protein
MATTTANDGIETRIGRQVETDIATRAARPAPGEPARLDDIAADLRSRAASDVERSERDSRVQEVVARLSQFVDLAFGIVYVLLIMRFGLALAGAHMGARFTRFLVLITNPFYLPFRGVLGTPEVMGGGQFVMSLLVALIAYLCLHLGVHQLLRVIAVKRRSI